MPPLELRYEDLLPFADLGTTVATEGDGFVLTRDDGSLLKVEPHGSGYAVTPSNGAVRHYSSAGEVLASTAFADLWRVARNQTVLLAPQRIEGRPVPIKTKAESIIGDISAFASDQKPWDALDGWLRERRQSQNPQGTDLLLIDGPAGVGKTTIVREAALLRAETYDGTAPLILQIASRGRVLQNIADLIAFSLQDVRANITVDQLMPLMRHGLITLAIDGFDELSDPDGFETAWSGLNSLLEGARGTAAFLLAGRETFVSTDTNAR